MLNREYKYNTYIFLMKFIKSKNKPDFSREETVTELVKCYLKSLLSFLLIAI